MLTGQIFDVRLGYEIPPLSLVSAVRSPVTYL